MTVTAAPAMLSAIGALGHKILTIPGPDAHGHQGDPRHVGHRAVGEGPHWFGVIGKPTKSGGLSVAGSKEIAYTTFAELSDTTSPLYQQIRQQAP